MNYKIFSNSIEENKIPPETYKEIYKIIIENYATGEKLSKDELKKIGLIWFWLQKSTLSRYFMRIKVLLDLYHLCMIKKGYVYRKFKSKKNINQQTIILRKW